ncbi:hypothetical protein FB446DRAFT_633387 [Lentinula raphanica]|nr:hypothetical protein FB446DRAFT_633387 [Lentinula raphanica]
MFGLIRRISNSVFPRPDRPWDDDATSNAPKIGRKRRLSSTERDLDEDQDEMTRSKKHRGDTPKTPSELPTGEASTSDSVENLSQHDAEDVQEVTQGVKEVELEDTQSSERSGQAEVLTPENVHDEEADVAPESVPLPEEVSGELDDTSSIASTPPAVTRNDQGIDASESIQTSSETTDVAAEREDDKTPLSQDVDDDATSVPVDSAEKSPAIERPKNVDELST